MAKHFDVIVVGAGGAMGSATCFELARRGVRVLGLEQFGIAHDRGNSHGHSRLIRLAYYEHPDYVPLLRRAYERWRELEKLGGETILELTGAIYAGPAGGDLIEGSRRAAIQHNIDHEFLDRSQLSKRFPKFHLPDDYVGIFEPAGGFLYPERAIAAFAKLATRSGAEIHTREPLRSWTDHSVTTDVGTYAADRIVFCGGAWTSKIVRDLGIVLRVTRQIMGWIHPENPAAFSLGQFPCWAIQQRDGSLYYGMPISSIDVGLKIAHHKPGPVVDPDHVSREATPDDARTIERMIDEVLPDARGPIASLRVCLYTNSPDQHFIIGEHPQHKDALIACGFSGHGFKFTSVVGEILADLAQRGKTDSPIEFFSPTRFQPAK